MSPISNLSTPFFSTSAKKSRNPLFVALDLGTNSVLMLAATATNGTLTESLELGRSTRLGEDVDKTGQLKPEAITRTLEAVADFLGHLPPDTPVISTAAGTSALRDAENRDVFLDAFQARFNIRPRVLSGTEEATITFAGAASTCPDNTKAITLDIGGGSTEIGAGDNTACCIARSLDLGCVRLAERYSLFECTPNERVERARKAAAELLEPTCQAIRDSLSDRCPLRIIASGGTATTIAAMALGITDHNRQKIEGYCTCQQTIRDTALHLFTLTSQHRSTIPGISPGRAPVLPAGLLILTEALRILQTDQVHITTRGLRYGLLLNLLKTS